MNYLEKILISLSCLTWVGTSMLFGQNNFGVSDPCEWNVMHPQVHVGAFKNEIRSVFQFRSPVNTIGASLCTGTLINQDDRTNGQLQQMFLTAYHCVDDYSQGDQIIFMFNYQSPNGSSIDVPNPNLLNGQFLLNNMWVRGNNGNTPTVGVPPHIPNVLPVDFRNFRYIHVSPVEQLGRWGDMAVMRIVEPIPAWFNVYYSGWNGLAPVVPQFVINGPIVGGTWDPMYGPAPFYLNHHPRGDIKKTSVQDDPVIFQAGENYVSWACWVVTISIDGILGALGIRRNGKKINTKKYCTYIEPPTFTTEWDHGTSEPGSSGSAFMNKNQRIVGNLSFGPTKSNYCTNPRLDFSIKFRNGFHAERNIRDALNYGGNAGISLGGQGITCYTQNQIQGELFPARDYQPDNHIRLQYENDLTISNTRVYPGSDFHIIASEIQIGPETIIDTPDSFLFEASDAPCGANKAPPSGTPREYYPDSSWYDPLIRQQYADSLCLTLSQLDSLVQGMISQNILNLIQNCSHVQVSPQVWDDQLNMAADSLCLSRAQLDSLMDGNVSQNIRNLIENCVYLDDDTTAPRQAYVPRELPPLETAFKLYPNPHRSSFSAELTLVDAGNVKLELHDLTGRFLMTLFAGELEAGTHLLEFNPELPAGVYLCHLTANGQTQTHKLFRTE